MAVFDDQTYYDKPQKFVNKFFNFLQIFVVFGAIVAVIYLFVLSPHEVIGRSMEPTYYEGEFLLADKVSYFVRTPKQGEVVIFKYDENHDYIKRVIAVPGDTVSVNNGKVFVNGEQLDESEYLDDSVFTANGNYFTAGRVVTVMEGTVVAFGDNRPHSSDSRNFGPIELEKIKGRVIWRVTPFDRFGAIKTARY